MDDVVTRSSDSRAAYVADRAFLVALEERLADLVAANGMVVSSRTATIARRRGATTIHTVHHGMAEVPAPGRTDDPVRSVGIAIMGTTGPEYGEVAYVSLDLQPDGHDFLYAKGRPEFAHAAHETLRGAVAALAARAAQDRAASIAAAPPALAARIRQAERPAGRFRDHLDGALWGATAALTPACLLAETVLLPRLAVPFALAATCAAGWSLLRSPGPRRRRALATLREEAAAAGVTMGASDDAPHRIVDLGHGPETSVPRLDHRPTTPFGI